MTDPLVEARHKAMDLLARREHTRKELVHKLTIRDFAEEVIETVVDRLTEENLQSDDRFAEAFANMRRKKGQGPVRILNELQERGVSQALQEEYVDARDPIWREMIKQVREKKFGSAIPKEYAQRAKQSRFLQYRGFTNDQIRQELS
ncbi:MAG: regulatory protein RecX [Gammaproteobacteria bacterium]